MPRAFGLYWGGIRLESLSTQHCWALSKSFIPTVVVWSVTKIWRRKAKTKKDNGEHSDLCDLEQVTLKPKLQVHHCLTIWLQIWYHSLLWGDSIRKGADLEKQNCLFGVHHTELGNYFSASLSESAIENQCENQNERPPTQLDFYTHQNVPRQTRKGRKRQIMKIRFWFASLRPLSGV